MGYFSNLAIDYIPYDHDCSYIPPEKQLLMRLEELEDRLEELTGKRNVYEYSASSSDNDLRYILPEHFKSATDVEAAIVLAINDLKDRYGIHIREEIEAEDSAVEEEVCAVDEISDMQIFFPDILSACSQPDALCVA